jgi:NADH-quinone oxidoreductase subunit C
MTTAAIVELFQRALPGAGFETVPATDEPTFFLEPAHLIETCRTLRDAPELQFAFLADVTAVDFWPREPRFEVVYHLVSIGTPVGSDVTPVAPARVRLKVRVSGESARLPTVSTIWPSANWAEREIWDLFGIAFDGHPDLRRILMPEDWDGYPLRKDYPVQVDLPARIHEPLQVTEEEFARNVRAERYVPGTRRDDGAPGGRAMSKPQTTASESGSDAS